MSSISMTGLGALITVVLTVLKVFGIELPDGSDKQIAESIASLVSIGLLIYGQLRRKDLIAGIIRR